MPRAEGPQQRLFKKWVFSKLDLRNAYWQIPMNPDSIEKTAFCPGQGMEYGNSLWCPKDSPEPHKLVNKAWTEFSRTVRIVLITTLITVLFFRWHAISCGRPSMCLKQTPQDRIHSPSIQMFIWQPSISHLGFQYLCEGVTPTAQQTQSVIDWPTPKSTKEVRSFLGFVNFYCDFNPRFADIFVPVTWITGKNATFRWNAEQQTTFKQLQQAMISPPLLDYPKLNDHFI